MTARNLMTVVGARPQFVKAATLSRALAQAGHAEDLIHTGQHYDDALSGVFFRQLGLKEPLVNLHVGSGQHGEQTARMLEGLERVMLDRKPELVIVYGDTNSTLAAVLAAAKLHIPIAHVEAGLRSHDMRMPEEINRVVADRLAALLFAPTRTAVDHLLREGTDAGRIHLVGDIMVDAALQFAPTDPTAYLARFGLRAKEYVFATIHRAENTDDTPRFLQLIAGLEEAAKRLPVLLCAHPRTLHKLQAAGYTPERIQVHGAIDYLSSLALTRSAAVVATDSGGLQKEAAVLGTPAVILRDRTEWSELVTAGWCRLLDDPAAVSATIIGSIGRTGEPIIEFHGAGMAATRMADVISGRT